jgi:MoaA/NifB/PqqE/SkfB family radical SAM enzyme
MRDKQPHGRDAQIDFDFFKYIVLQMVNEGVKEIGLFYLGESFSAFKLLHKAVRYCKNIGVEYVFLTSNGTLAFQDRVALLMEAGLDSLKWSVNCADPKQYHEVTGVSPELFWKQLKNIHDAWDIREEVGYSTKLYASSIRYDGEQHERMQDTIGRYVAPFVDEHYWLPLYGMAMTAKRMQEDTGWTPNLGNIGRYDESMGTGNRHDQPVCWSAFTEGHVRSDGHMSACCFGATDRFDVGDLAEQSFMEAWNSPAYQAIREAQLRYAVGEKDALKGTMCEVCVAYE